MIREIEAVYMVYAEKSFSKAAKKLFLTQPALSNIVKRAEEEIGVPIFDRSTIPLTVTKEGEYYIRAIQEIRQIQSNVFAYFEDLKELKTGTLSLGGSSYFCSFVFPEMISRFKLRYPNVEICLNEGNIDHIRKGLEDGSNDLILETAIHKNEPGIESYFYKNEHIIVAVPSDYPVNSRLQPYRLKHEDIITESYLNEEQPCVPLIALKDVPFISMKEGNDILHRSRDICRNAGFQIQTTISVDQVITSINIASAGSGALFVRADIVRHLPDDGRLVYYKIGDPLSVRAINWSVRKGRYLSKAAQEFMRIAGTPAFNSPQP